MDEPLAAVSPPVIVVFHLSHRVAHVVCLGAQPMAQCMAQATAQAVNRNTNDSRSHPVHGRFAGLLPNLAQLYPNARVRCKIFPAKCEGPEGTMPSQHALPNALATWLPQLQFRMKPTKNITK